MVIKLYLESASWFPAFLVSLSDSLPRLLYRSRLKSDKVTTKVLLYYLDVHDSNIAWEIPSHKECYLTGIYQIMPWYVMIKPLVYISIDVTYIGGEVISVYWYVLGRCISYHMLTPCIRSGIPGKIYLWSLCDLKMVSSNDWLLSK